MKAVIHLCAQEERAMLLDVWRKFEANLGTENAENLRNVESKLPRKIKKRRKIPTEDGVSVCLSRGYGGFNVLCLGFAVRCGLGGVL